ncbi:MAG: GNAT family N-acetyltransferase [Oscillospiraceae bacterium]|nr:GNAT family N-acetyltransferase [Oscillospiraceae bacterium]
MPVFEIRTAMPGDVGALKDIWRRVFGDPDEYIEAYFEDLYEEGQAVAAVSGGEIAGCAYALPLGELVRADSCEKCGVGYAFAVLPEYRGLGMGRALTDRVIEEFKKRGFGAICIYPAERSLFDFYRPSGFREFFYKLEYSVKAGELAHMCPQGRAAQADSGKYGAVRERLLSGRCHIRYEPSRIRHQSRLCEMSGGGLYIIDCGGTEGCAAVECSGGRAYVKELIIPEENRARALALLHEKLGAGEYIVRAPGRGEPCAMLVMPDAGTAGDEPWYGLPYD